MIELGGVRWTNENPAIYLSFYYEKERVGAAMRYRVQVNLSAVTGASSFGYDVNLGVYMDGAWKTGTQLVRTGEKQWAAKSWVSDWITIPDRTSGTTTVSFNVYSTGGARRNGTYSYAMVVDPAASTLSAANGTLGQAQTLTLTRYSAAFKDTITWTCGTASGTIAALSQETSFDFTPPLELAAQATAAAAVEIRFTVSTYQADGTTLVATSTTTIAAAIPDTVKPSCTLAVSDTTDNLTTYGAYVQGQSRLHLVVTPTLAYGSQIASYQIIADGKTYTQADITTDPISGSGTLTLTARVTDRRGRTSDAATATITVLPCTAPQISAFAAQRCNADGELDEEGLYIKVTFSAAISPLDNQNTAAYRVRYKKTGTEEWTTITLTAYAGQYSVTDGTTIFAAAAADAWDVQIAAQDAFTETAQTRNVAIAFSLVNYNASGRGLAFGRISQIEDAFEVDMPAQFYKTVDLVTPLAIASGGTGAGDADGARANLIVAQKPKLLWWGVFSNGSITVDGLSDYTHFLIQMNGALLLGTVSSGIISLGTFQCDSSAAGWATLMTANVAVNGDTLTMNHTFYVSVNNTNWYQSASDAHVQINGIWGLYKANDIQEVTA